MSGQVVQAQPESRHTGQWSTGLCECYKDVGDCCFALCCLPVFTCKVTRAVGACPCLPLLDCIGCVPSASLAMRASVRQRYGIKCVERLPVWMLLLSAILAPDLQGAEEKSSGPRLVLLHVSSIHCSDFPAGGALGLD
ncbi:uncharacterized protein V6R79_016333 [Siganus canaliculatus]